MAMTMTLDALKQKYPLPEGFCWKVQRATIRIMVEPDYPNIAWWLFRCEVQGILDPTWSVERDDPAYNNKRDDSRYARPVATVPTVEEACALMYHLFVFDLRS